MKLDDLEPRHLVEVHKLWEEHVGFEDISFESRMYDSPERFLKDLIERHGESYRIGSRWDGHSRLEIRVNWKDEVTFRFYENFDIKDRKGRRYKEARAAGEAFEKAVENYFASLGF